MVKKINRFSAFFVHLIFSLTVGCIIGVLVYCLWYPDFFSYASGISKIFLTLLVVDVILGPLITLIIFNTKKQELKRDMLIVIVVQIIALSFGLYTVFITRPAYIIFNSNRFDLVYANEISEENLGKALRSEFKSLPYFGPKIIAAVLPADPRLAEEIIISAVATGDDVQYLPQYYASYNEHLAEVIKQNKLLSEMKFANVDRLKEIDKLCKKYEALNIEVGYIPLKAKTHNLVVIVDRGTGKILEISDLKPWK